MTHPQIVVEPNEKVFNISNATRFGDINANMFLLWSESFIRTLSKTF